MYYQVIHRRCVRSIHTGCHIFPEEWDGAAFFLNAQQPQARKAILQMAASRVQWGMRQLAAIVREKEEARMDFSVDDIVAAYKGLPPYRTWFGFVNDMAERKERTGREGTAKTYREAGASFARFRDGQDLPIELLDADTMAMYEDWLKRGGLKRNSSSCYLRTLRTIYRKAVDMGLTADRNIFRHVYTGFAKTTKRAVPLETIRAIRGLHLPNGSPLDFARDLFLLSLYLQGMSFVDMAYLRKSDIRCGLLQYERKKTGQSLAVGWEKPMQDIVGKYKHLTEGSPYLLPIIRRADGTERKQYERMEHNVNRNLKKIGHLAGARIPLTTYVARHTWASGMRDMGCDLSVVSMGLGHESLATTQIYLSSIDTATVAKANRKMLGKILK